MNNAHSIAAYVAIKPRAADCRQRVYNAIEQAVDGLTREEIEEAIDMSGNTVRPRVRELIKSKRILESGLRLTRSGQSAAVLRVNAPHQLTLLDMTKGKRN